MTAVDGPVDRPAPPLDGEELTRRVAAVVGSGLTACTVQWSEYATSFPVHDVVAVAGGSVRRFVLKDLRWSSLSPAARLAKRPDRHDPAREVGTYRWVLGDPPGPPVCHAASHDGRGGWVLLEHVPGRELYQWGDIGAWAAAARWLARFHARWADPGERARVRRRVPVPDDEVHPVDDEALRDALDASAAHLAALPGTIVHGECYASNVLVGDDGRVAVLDWETTAVGPGWVDLASLVVGWQDRERGLLLEAYLSELPHALRPRDPEVTLAAAELAVSRRWLAAHPAWSAPAEHRRDWRAEAVAAAGRAGWG